MFGSDEEYEQEAREIDETFAVFGQLEAQHTTRGLTFDRVHLNAVPVQAFGTVDGKHFYFRFRHDHASLQVGPFDEALEDAAWSLLEQIRMRRLSRLPAGAKSFARMLHEAPTRRNVPGDGYLPIRVTDMATIDELTGDDLAGYLTATEFAALFNRLFDLLTPVPEPEQVPNHTRKWLAASGLWPLTGTPI